MSKVKVSKELSYTRYYKKYWEQYKLWNYQWNTNISKSDLCFNKMQTRNDKWLSQINDT